VFKEGVNIDEERLREFIDGGAHTETTPPEGDYAVPGVTAIAFSESKCSHSNSSLFVTFSFSVLHLPFWKLANNVIPFFCTSRRPLGSIEKGRCCENKPSFRVWPSSQSHSQRAKSENLSF
jgi:hypothetical protein